MSGTFYTGECLHPVASGCCWTGGGVYMHKTSAAESTFCISPPNRAKCGVGKMELPGTSASLEAAIVNNKNQLRGGYLTHTVIYFFLKHNDS